MFTIAQVLGYLGPPGVAEKAMRHTHVWSDHRARPFPVHQEDHKPKYKGGTLCVDQVEHKFDPWVLRAGAHDGAELEEDVGGHGVDPEHEGGEGVEDQVAGEDAGEGVGGETLEVFAEILPDETDVGNEIVDHETESDLAKERFVEIGVYDVDKYCGEKENGGDGQGNRVDDESEVLKRQNFRLALPPLQCTGLKFSLGSGSDKSFPFVRFPDSWLGQNVIWVWLHLSLLIKLLWLWAAHPECVSRATLGKTKM